MDAPAIFSGKFLEVRARILELGAVLDRLDRAEGSVEDDSRIAAIHEAIAVLQSNAPDRAEQIQMIFSREYQDDWRDKFEL